MKFIISSFSWEMFDQPNITVDRYSLSEEEFQMAILDGVSHVGHEDIAQLINVAYNKQPVHARIGDVLLYANKCKGVLKFYLLIPRENDVSIYREEELYAEEML